MVAQGVRIGRVTVPVEKVNTLDAYILLFLVGTLLLRVLGVTLNSRLAMGDHMDRIIATCASTRFARACFSMQ